MRAMRIAIIGAGAAGLAMLREATRGGVEATVFERGTDVGGVWVHDPRPEHGPMYASLRTNLPRPLMSFDRFPFGGELPWFPGHADVADYLRAFARHVGAYERTRFETAVASIEPRLPSDRPWRGEADLDVGWRLTSGAGNVEHFDAVAVCNGHYWTPRIPEIPGAEAFPGEVLHSLAYREPSGFAGQRVALLGAKASGVDLSRDIGRVASRVLLCARGQTREGPQGPRGNIVRTPSIVRLHGDGTAELEDGSREGIDALVWCTGYRYDFPFLDPTHGILDEADHTVSPLWLDLIAARVPSLSFIGLPSMVVPFAMFERQAALFVALLTGRAVLPPYEARLAESARHEASLLEAGTARRHLLRHDERQFPYLRDLERRSGYRAAPEWFAPLHRAVARLRRTRPDEYRDLPLPIDVRPCDDPEDGFTVG